MNNKTKERYRDGLSLTFSAPSIMPEAQAAEVNGVISQMRVMQSFIDRALAVEEANGLPKPLTDSLERIVDSHSTYIDQLKLITEVGAERDKGFSNRLSAFKNYYNSFFEISSNLTMPTLSAVMASSNSASIEYELLSKYKDLAKNVGDKISSLEEISKELQIKASEEVVANYALIFANEEAENRAKSEKWFIASIVVMVSFVIFIICSNYTPFLNIYHETTLDGVNSINYSTLASKIIIVSVWLYFVSFSFKQFSIKKHLQTVNTHRKNALNSYKLFSASIHPDDMASRNALMLQVAKAIYEYNTTGYLSNKQVEGSGSGFLEVTKFISENKTGL